jgi:threonine dehydratase
VQLLNVVAESGGNVMEVTHNRISPEVPYGWTGVEMLVEVRDENHIHAIEQHLTDSNFPVRRLD